jgi:hypothetical protein
MREGGGGSGRASTSCGPDEMFVEGHGCTKVIEVEGECPSGTIRDPGRGCVSAPNNNPDIMSPRTDISTSDRYDNKGGGAEY